jgi:nucleotide-binding universal stress UspA family protein
MVLEREFIQETRTSAEQHVSKCQAALLAGGVKSRSSVEVGNDIVGNIARAVEREHIEMVVISTHGISGWHPLVFGSIAEKVIKLVQCPLLLLRSAQHETGVKTSSRCSMERW